MILNPIQLIHNNHKIYKIHKFQILIMKVIINKAKMISKMNFLIIKIHLNNKFLKSH
jgi:hypothetical protein